jgi:hypothetical protein
MAKATVERGFTVGIVVLGLAFGTMLTVLSLPELGLFDFTRRHPLVIGLHRAHDDLNAAVGYDRWEPEHLEGTADDLRALAVRYDNAGAILEDAATEIDHAVAENDRQSAVVAHRIVDGLEARVRDELRRERERLRLPMT